MSEESRFFGFLKDRIGLDVASVGEATIERAVRQRLTICRSADSESYWQLLQTSADEQQALIEAVIVPETWFFRYPESFVTLGKLAMARVGELAGARPLRILSLPCSTGEEPYSIAMALFDAGLASHQFKVNAIDISPLSIQRARLAVYGKNSFRGSEIGYRDRYFTPLNDGYQLEDRVRERVDFQTGNLLDPQLLFAQSAYDFVFCRNLLIYFDVETQRQVLTVLKRMTLEDGVLFIGPAEGSLLSRLGMRSIGIAQSFAFVRQEEIVQEPAPVFVATPFAELPRPAPRPISEPVARPRPRSFALPPLPGAGQLSVVPGKGADALLAEIARLANEGKSADAQAACERYLQHHEPVAPVFYWLGLLSEVAGKAADAQGFYRKALYLQPQHPETLAQLAALLASQGDAAGALRLQQRAARSVNKEGSNR
jgi:chemotaxis protein methyltransferase WspC